jgi:hypothetical protein
VKLSPRGTSATLFLLYQPRMIVLMIMKQRMEWAVRETEVLGEVQLSPPQIHDLTRDRNRAFAVGSQLQAAWDMTRQIHVKLQGQALPVLN